MTDAAIIRDHLALLISERRPGDRLPTVRELMTLHQASQAAVQKAFAELRDEGLISVHVGRGTFVVDTARTVEPASAAKPSVLMLSRQVESVRRVFVLERLHQLLEARGYHCVTVTCNDFDHAMRILHGVPRFDACVLRAYFEVMPAAFVDFLQQRARMVVIDGGEIAGIDVDSVAADWRAALDLAVLHLREIGHRRIAFLTLDSTSRPILAGRRQFESMRGLFGWSSVDSPLIQVPEYPADRTAMVAVLTDALARHMTNDGFPFGALVLWGVRDGRAIAEALRALDVPVPGPLSVVAIGHHDVEFEHVDLFTSAGTDAELAAASIADRIEARLADPFLRHETVFLPTRLVERASTRFPRDGEPASALSRRATSPDSPSRTHRR